MLNRFAKIIVVALLILPFTLPALGEVVAREGQGYLEIVDGQRVLHLKGSYYEIGYQHGVLLKDMVQENVTRIVDNNEEIGQTKEYMMYKLMRVGMQERLKPHIPEKYKEEMRGLADGAGIPYEDALTANLFPEAFHCSGIALMDSATKNGDLYHVRILDYMTGAGLQNSAVCMMVEPEGANAFMNIGYAGCIGSITGMNEKQVTIGEMGGAGQGHWDGIPMTFLIRDALERADTLKEALKIFDSAPRTCEYFYVISDAKINDARGIYATPKRIQFVKPGEPYAMFDIEPAPEGDSGGNRVVVKDFEMNTSPVQMLLESKDGDMISMINLQPEDSVIVSGEDRYRYFAERLLKQHGKVDEKLLIEMIKRPVAMKSNLHNAIFHPSTLEAWVAHASPDGEPACDQEYHHFKLVKQDEELKRTTMAK